jgi:uncharacterized RDD family membrane protein YckC
MGASMERIRPQGEAEIGRFFQRIFAAGIDGIILVTVFLSVTVPLLGLFSPETVLAQTGINLFYYAVLNSAWGGGATLGKRLMGLRVIDRHGDYIGIGRSLWRAGFDLLPTGVGAYLAVLLQGTTLPLAEIGAAAGTAFALTNLYLYICNLQTRQVLHDLAAATFVVQADTSERPFTTATPLVHLAFTLILVAALGYTGWRVIRQREAIQGPQLCVAPVTDAVRSLPFVTRAFVDRNPTTLLIAADPDRTLITAFVQEGFGPVQARTIARTALTACPAMRDERLLRVVLIPPHKRYSLKPQMGVYAASVGEWRESLTDESRAAKREGPCSAAIARAVKMLAFAQDATVEDLHSPPGRVTLHARRVLVVLKDNKAYDPPLARAVAKAAMAACPAMEDGAILDIGFTAQGRRSSSYPGTAKEWRESLAYETVHKRKPAREH